LGDRKFTADESAKLRRAYRAPREAREADRIKAVVALATDWSAEQVAEPL